MKSKSSVTKTASDAVMAKWSAIGAGHEPVTRNSNIYCDLLQKVVSATTSGNSSASTRQTPLVNAGYAARIGSVTSLVNNFISFHSSCEDSSAPVQLVILGCGFDVTGLWAYSLSANRPLRVYEVDFPEICSAKQDIIVSLGLLRITKSSDVREDHDGVASGVMELNALKGERCEEDSAMEAVVSNPNYMLIPADLRDTASLEKTFPTLNASCPTLVISELVLAYLGPTGTDSLLDFCASHICGSTDGALVLYEPLGASVECKRIYSVTEGYKRSYDLQFASKLDRGTAKPDDESSNSTKDDNELYHPLGSSCVDVERRLRQAGFSSAHASFAGIVAASSFEFRSTELFDEHAALALHLRIYSVACAFSRGTSVQLKRKMCSWSKRIILENAVSVTETDKGFRISPIELQHQEQVRNLFKNTYEELFDDYPAVKKMVKTALKTDLSGKDENESSLDTDADSSSIGNRYRDQGGIFIVCLDDTGECSCRVLGCVGVRPCSRTEVCGRGYKGKSFEIHRLAVDANCREQGIGRALLAAVERFLFVSSRKGESSICLVATTPAMLKAANQLYQKCGFELQDETDMGKISMRTYLKSVAIK